MIRSGRSLFRVVGRMSGRLEIEGESLEGDVRTPIVRYQDRFLGMLLGVCHRYPRHPLCPDHCAGIGEFHMDDVASVGEDLREDRVAGEAGELSPSEAMDGVFVIGKRDAFPARLVAAADVNLP